MPLHRPANDKDPSALNHRPDHGAAERAELNDPSIASGMAVQNITRASRLLTVDAMLQLQRTVGNQAVLRSIAPTTPHANEPGKFSLQTKSLVQRSFIIGDPQDGSYYNAFDVSEAYNTILHRGKFHPKDILAPLQHLDTSGRQNYTGWNQLERDIKKTITEMRFSKSVRKNIDELAFLKAKDATEHLIPPDIKVEWKYAGNIGEATTRFVTDRENGGLKIVVDVNPVEEFKDYSQLNYEWRIGERTTMFTHELAYHGNKEAYQRFLSNTDDPDLDHRLIFMRETRDKYFTGFLHALMDRKLKPAEKKALVESWYSDVKFHIEEYGADDNEKAEALEWLEEAKEELDSNLEGSS